MKKMTHYCFLALSIFGMLPQFAIANDSTKHHIEKVPDAENAGLKLPAGFVAIKAADNLGRTRHLVVTEQGDVYTKVMGRVAEGKGIIKLHDANGDGKFEVITGFGNYGGTGITIKSGYLYASSDQEVFRYKLNDKANYQASFVGYFPADFPKYSCIAVVYSPSSDVYYGASVAGPIFKEISDKIFSTFLTN